MLRKVFINQVEEQMLSFINLVENFSKSDDDIISIFDRANQYMKNPMKDIVNEFVLDARLSADLNGAFGKFIKQFKGTKAADVFYCLWICSKHDSNYSEVIKDMKISIKEHLRTKKIIRAIINSAKIDMVALGVAGIMVINILNGFLSQNVFVLMMASVLGRLILIYCIVVLMVAAYVLIWR